MTAHAGASVHMVNILNPSLHLLRGANRRHIGPHGFGMAWLVVIRLDCTALQYDIPIKYSSWPENRTVQSITAVKRGMEAG